MVFVTVVAHYFASLGLVARCLRSETDIRSFVAILLAVFHFPLDFYLWNLGPFCAVINYEKTYCDCCSNAIGGSARSIK